MIKFLATTQIWPRITTLAKSTAKAHVAVAYFGQEASRLLPLKSGSVLVVDCTPKSVKGGRTCPHDLLTLLKKKVEVHSCSNLHAKVFVFGKRAIIGSNNASNLSKNYLLEAAIETTNQEAVADCKAFINSLRGDQVSPKYAKKLCTIWNPPKFSVPRAASKTPRRHPLWLLPLVLEDWDETANKKDKEAEPIARKKLKSRKRFVLNKFHWEEGDQFFETVKVGHQIIQVIAGKLSWVHPPSRVIHVKRYMHSRKRQLLAYLETPRVKPAKRKLDTVLDALGPLKGKLVIKHAGRRVSDPQVAHVLYQLWPGHDSGR